MTGNTVSGRNGDGARAGARTLNLLAAPLNSQILRGLREKPRPQADLRRSTGHPAQTTLRAQLNKFCGAGVVVKRRRNRFPGVLEYELSDSGRDLLPTIDLLERWLAEHPDHAIGLGSSAAKATIKALTEGWSTAMLRALAARPLILTELDAVITSLSYPSVERRLAAMRLARLVEARESRGRGTPYGVTDWARRGVGPLLAAARWERRHVADETAPASKLDVETAFLLTAGLVSPPPGTFGSCRLTVELQAGDSPLLAGLLFTVEDERTAFETTLGKDGFEAWASGDLSAWFSALIDGDLDRLERGGNGAFAQSTVEWLHNAVRGLPVSD